MGEAHEPRPEGPINATIEVFATAGVCVDQDRVAGELDRPPVRRKASC
jgi:hypothetical protein